MVFPTIMPANSVSGFNITNSLRLDDGGNSSLAFMGKAYYKKVGTSSIIDQLKGLGKLRDL